jgi:hypothetical protein
MKKSQVNFGVITIIEFIQWALIHPQEHPSLSLDILNTKLGLW